MRPIHRLSFLLLVGVSVTANGLFSSSSSSSVSPSVGVYDNLTWIKGINYVPSWVHNDMGTLLDYNTTLVEQELRYATSGGFNAVRLFLHWLPWVYNRTRVLNVLDHFVSTAYTNGMRTLFVILDSCCNDANPDLSWITDQTYKNSTWMPNPGTILVANESAWADIDLYIVDIVSRYANDPRLLGWDVMNEPNFDSPNILNFLAHYTSLIQTIDTNPDHIVTVGIAYAGQQSYVQDMVRTLSFHSYDGGGNPLGTDLANIIAGQQNLSLTLQKPVILTESMGRPGDPLSAVLPAVLGCYPGINTPIGFFLWELMLGVDQFNYDWSNPYQGLIYPSWAQEMNNDYPVGGTWWSSAEQELYVNLTNTSVPGSLCPWTPINNYTTVEDTDPRIIYTPMNAWTWWNGSGPVDGHLHYSNTAGAEANVTLSNGQAYSILYKTGPDCAIMHILVGNATDTIDIGTIDTYDSNVNWGTELMVIPKSYDSSSTYWIYLNNTGTANPLSSNKYTQLVGYNIYV